MLFVTDIPNKHLEKYPSAYEVFYEPNPNYVRAMPSCFFVTTIENYSSNVDFFKFTDVQLQSTFKASLDLSIVASNLFRDSKPLDQEKAVLLEKTFKRLLSKSPTRLQ